MKTWKIRRPLALFCLLFMAVAGLFMMLLRNGTLASGRQGTPGSGLTSVSAGEECRLAGTLIRKEFKKGRENVLYGRREGDEEPAQTTVWTVRTQGSPSYKVLCYPTDEAAALDPPVGARLVLNGRAKDFSEATNPGEFDAREYYTIQGMDFQMTNVSVASARGGGGIREGLFKIRCRLAASLSDCFTKEDAGILRAMILGDRSAMDKDTQDLYRQSGIIHVLAVSGLHITLIGMGLFRLLRLTGCPKVISIPVCMLVMLAYGEMCGQTPSAVRAIIMFLMRLTALLFGYSYDILTALAVAAFLLVIEQPLYLTYSGFLFSFLSVLAIAVLYPCLTPKRILNYSPSRGDPPWKSALIRLLSSVFASLSVSAVTLPVYMLYYHTFPVYAVFLNVLILPLMTLVVADGILCMGLGLFWARGGMLFGMPDHLLLRLFRILCLSENELPGAVWVTGHAAGTQVAVYYGILIAFSVLVLRLREKNRRKPRKAERESGRPARMEAWLAEGVVARGLILGCAVLLLAVRIPEPLKITFLDVGQGDGIVIRGRNTCVMIDGGSSSRSSLDSYVLTPFLAYEGISRLDAAILTHEDEDHMNGLLALLENEKDFLQIDRLYLPAVQEAERGEGYDKLLRAAAEHGIPVYTLAAGDQVLAGELSIACLGPPAGLVCGESNAHSTILYLTFGSFDALFTGDVEGEGEAALLDALAQNPDLADGITLLKVAHHGSRYTTSDALLDRLKPQLAVISCGRNNRYGHPHEELLQRLHMHGCQVYRTDHSGCIAFRIKQKMLTIDTFCHDEGNNGENLLYGIK